MKLMLDFTVRANEPLNEKNNLLRIAPSNNQPLPEMKPGQFVQILVENSPSTYLRRPISINMVDYNANELWLLVQQVGDGTKKICEAKPNDTINIIFPLGNSFTKPSDKSAKTLLIGGGVGTAPMLFLGQQLHNAGFKPNFLLGGRSASDLLLLSEFERYGTVYCTTEDGSAGEKGFVTHHSILEQQYDNIYTCGPKPMMLAVAKYAQQKGISCQVSLENMMACGFGACLCCVEKTVKGNICVCTEGPVFDIKELTWTN